MKEKLKKTLRTTSSAMHKCEQWLENTFVNTKRWVEGHKFLVGLLLLIFLIVVLATNGVANFFFAQENAARGELLRFLGVVAGGGLVLWGLFINNKRVKEQTRQNEIAEQGQINTRFKDAAMLLSSQETSAVLSGIHALNQIAQDAAKNKKNEEYIKIIHDILCSFIRERNSVKLYEANPESIAPTIVTQTVMGVLFGGIDGTIYREYWTDLYSCVISHVNLKNFVIENANFQMSRFDNVTLIGASLKEINFRNAKISNTRFDKAIMNNIYLMSAIIDESTFMDTVFSNVNFFHARITMASFIEAILNDVYFGSTTMDTVVFAGARFSKVELSGAILKGVDFQKTLFENVPLEELTSFKSSLSLTTPQ